MPATFVATADSVRERILVEVENLYSTQERSGGYTFAWDTVIRSPLLEEQRRKNFELAILDRSELKEIQIQTQHATLEIDLEWSVLGSQKDEMSQLANMVLLALERRLNENVYMFENGDNVDGQQLALRAWTVGNDYTIDNDTDRRIEGVMLVRILYKHAVSDPRQQIG
jgi:hypothetical protein